MSDPHSLDAHQTKDTALYDRVLAELLKLADADAKLLSLMSYVTKNELPANATLATAVVAVWKKSPDRSGTSKALHFAALSDDANVYQDAVEQALAFWREGKLPDVSAIELRALFDGEFWILSSRTQEFRRWFCFEAHPRQRAPRIGSGGERNPMNTLFQTCLHSEYRLQAESNRRHPKRVLLTTRGLL